MQRFSEQYSRKAPWVSSRFRSRCTRALHSSGALNRSINAQAEHWLRVGMLAELNLNLCYGEICRLLLASTNTAVEVPMDRNPAGAA